jgi:predicted RNase H-like HicB family nuclease
MVSCEFTVSMESAQEGGFIVKCLELPVSSEGETQEEALSNIKEAILGYLDSLVCKKPLQNNDASPNN